jgi:2-dehydropantoate 2-reductase
MKKVAVLGAGGIGGWLAGALAEVGVDVSVVARGATLTAIRERGLRLTRDGKETTYRLAAGSSTELGAQDLVIIATKGQDVTRALPDIAPLLHAKTTVVSALNGLPWWFTQRFPGPLNNVVLESVDPGGAVAAAIAPERAVGCVVHASAAQTAPGCIRIAKLDTLFFGEPDGHISQRVQWLADTFARSGVKTVASTNIRLETWAKLWGNMNMNPLGALSRSTTVAMLDDPDVNKLCLYMMEEMAEAGKCIGLPFAMSAAERMVVTRKLGAIRPSMLNDLDNGAALEWAPQIGAVVEVAQRAGVPAPFCESVLGLTRLLSNAVEAARKH